MWQLVSVDGETRAVFVIETTLELDPSQEDYNAENVARLRSAAREHLRELLPSIKEASGVLLFFSSDAIIDVH